MNPNERERVRRAVQLAWLSKIERERELRREAWRDTVGVIVLAVLWAGVAVAVMAW